MGLSVARISFPWSDWSGPKTASPGSSGALLTLAGPPPLTRGEGKAEGGLQVSAAALAFLLPWPSLPLPYCSAPSRAGLMKELLTPYGLHSPLFGAVLEPEAPSVAPRTFICLSPQGISVLGDSCTKSQEHPLRGLRSSYLWGGGLSAVCNNVMSYLFSGINILYCI